MSRFVRRGPYALAAGMLSSPVWIPLEESEWRRGVLTHTIGNRQGREQGKPALPFGWMIEHDFDRGALIVGPWWVILPRRIWFRYRWSFHRLALRIGAAELAEGGYYRDARWWPNCPRFEP